MVRKRLDTSLSDIKSKDNQFCRNIDRQLISEEGTLLWLSRRDLKGKTRGEIIESQNQALQIRYHGIKMWRRNK